PLRDDHGGDRKRLVKLSPRALDLHRRIPRRTVYGISTLRWFWNDANYTKFGPNLKKERSQHALDGSLGPGELSFYFHGKDLAPVGVEEVGRRVRPVAREDLGAAERSPAAAHPGPRLPLLLVEVRDHPDVAAQVGQRLP